MPTSSHLDTSEAVRPLDESDGFQPSRTSQILVGIIVVALTVFGFAVVGTSFKHGR